MSGVFWGLGFVLLQVTVVDEVIRSLRQRYSPLQFSLSVGWGCTLQVGFVAADGFASSRLMAN